MDKGRIIYYQKKFSNTHLGLMLLVAILILEHRVSGYTQYVTGIAAWGVIVTISELFGRCSNYFNNGRFITVFRYGQMLSVVLLMSVDWSIYIELTIMVLYVLFAFEFLISLDFYDQFVSRISLILVGVPVVVIEIFRLLSFSINTMLISDLVTIVIPFLVLNAIFQVFSDEMIRLDNKFMEQSRYIEDATAVNHQLVENQEKIKKANEQLAYQKVQLEFAYSRINHVNLEILLQNQILKLISENHEVNNLMSLIAQTIRTQMEVDIFAIVIYPDVVNYNGLMYQIQSTYGQSYEEFLGEKIEQGCLDYYIARNETYVDNHVVSMKYEFVEDKEISSLMVIPLSKEENIIGGLYIADSKYEAFNDNVPFFEATVSSINIAVETSNLYAKLEEMAITDDLTQIYNRRYLNQICDRFICEAQEQGTQLSVALFDIDKFKSINDSYGHLFGDEALKIIAHMAQEIAERTGGVAGRYGGEEFVVLFPNRGLEYTYEIVKEYHDEIRNKQFNYGSEVVRLRLSIGIASYPETCEDPNDLLNYADWAMYYSKENGRDRITIDSVEVREQVRMKQ